MRGRTLCSRRCGVEGTDGQSHAQGHHFGERDGDRRARPASSQTIRRNLEFLSAHADADEILRWLRSFKSAPRTTFITHGEPSASDALRHRVEEELH
jgi:Cft2 family RNA processing exonuclease